MTFDLVIEAGAVVTMDPAERVLAPGWLAVRDGSIAALGKGSPPRAQAVRELAAPDAIALPGIVNAHTHLFQVLIRDLYDGLPFNDWLRGNYHVGLAMDAGDWRASAMLGAAESLLAGVTTVVDHQFLHDDTDWSEAIIDGAGATGIRLALARTAMDAGALAPAQALEDEATALGAVDRLLDAHRDRIEAGMLRILGGGTTPGVSPSGALTAAAARHARRRGIGLSVHVAEARTVVEAVRSSTGIDGVVRWLESIDALQPGMIAAHAVHVDADEIAALARHGVAVAHNPVSNLFLGDGIAPAAAMLDAGVVVALGTDGASSNGSQDPWENLKTAVLLSRVRSADSRWLTPRDGLRMATINGARALAMERVMGSLEVGKRADIVVVEAAHAPHAVGTHDPVSHLVYAARAADVRTVVVDGRIVVDEGQLVTVDQVALLAEARDRARRLSDRLRLSA
jgi:5-methylthioadenosine/S-adenosylhomocysteine deaminase